MKMILAIISKVILFLAVVAAVLLMLYRFYFLRKPQRIMPEGNVVVSPADGKVVRILRVDKSAGKLKIDKGILGRINLLTEDTINKGHIIVIMMTPLNVHFQRSPVPGKVENIKHTRGLFLNAVKDAASLNALHNEKNEIIIHNRKIGRIKVVQVAGFLARRIRCFVKKGQKLDKGEEIGLICLGSQVILVIPDLRLEIKEDQKVIDGQTIIARF